MNFKKSSSCTAQGTKIILRKLWNSFFPFTTKTFHSGSAAWIICRNSLCFFQTSKIKQENLGHVPTFCCRFRLLNIYAAFSLSIPSPLIWNKNCNPSGSSPAAHLHARLTVTACCLCADITSCGELTGNSCGRSAAFFAASFSSIADFCSSPSSPWSLLLKWTIAERLHLTSSIFSAVAW